MRHLTILLTLAALAGATDKLSAVGDIADNRGAGLIQFRISDSLALARFRADSTEAQHLWVQGDSLRAVLHWKGDSLQIFLHGKGQDHLDVAYKHLQQDTARNAP